MPLKTPPPRYSDLDRAKRRVELGKENPQGIECPCCGQLCKLYRRKLNSAMSICLIGLVKIWKIKPGWVSIHRIPFKGKDARVAGGELAKLVHWDLIIPKPNDDDSKRCSGMWKPTKKGIQFVENMIQLPSHVFIFNNIVYGFSSTMTTIEESLGEKFDYTELMES